MYRTPKAQNKAKEDVSVDPLLQITGKNVFAEKNTKQSNNVDINFQKSPASSEVYQPRNVYYHSRDIEEDEAVTKDEILDRLGFRKDDYGSRANYPAYAFDQRENITTDKKQATNALISNLEKEIEKLKYKRDTYLANREKKYEMNRRHIEEEQEEVNEIMLHQDVERLQKFTHTISSLEKPTLENVQALLRAQKEKAKELEQKYMERKKVIHYEAQQDSGRLNIQNLKSLEAEEQRNLEILRELMASKNVNNQKNEFAREGIEDEYPSETYEFLQNEELIFKSKSGLDEDSEIFSDKITNFATPFKEKVDLDSEIKSTPKKQRVTFLSEENSPEILETESQTTSSVTENVCLLPEDIMESIKDIFHETDKYGDLIVKRQTFVKKLREDFRISRALQKNAVYLYEIDRYLSLDKVLSQIEDEEINNPAKEYVSLSQFLKYFTHYETPKSLVKQLINSDKMVTPKKFVRIEQDNQEIMELNPKYISFFKEIFDSLAGNNGRVETMYFVDRIRGEEGYKIFQKEFGRRHGSALEKETIEEVINKVEDEAGMYISWNDFLQFFTRKDESKNILIQYNTTPIKSEKEVIRGRTKEIVKEKVESEPSDSLEIPQNSEEFNTPKKVRAKSIRERRVQEMIEEKRLEEEAALNYRFRAKSVPSIVQVPLLEKIIQDQEQRRAQLKKELVAITKIQEAPFQFYLRDKNKTPKKEPAYNTEFQKQFKAKPIPAICQLTDVYKDMKEREEIERKERVARKAQENLALASLPPRMAMHENRKKAEELVNRIHQDEKEKLMKEKKTFVANEVPDFERLHRKQHEQLERKKNNMRPTEQQPFSFQPSKVRDNKYQYEDREIKSEISKRDPCEEAKRVISAKPKIEPKTTKKMVAIGEQRRKKREEKQRMIEQLEKEEEERRARYEKMKPIVQGSMALTEYKLQKQEREVKVKREIQDKLQQDHSNYQQLKQEMESNLNNRPLLVEQEAIRNKKVELQALIELNKLNKIMKEAGVKDPGAYFTQEERDKIEDALYLEKKGLL